MGGVGETGNAADGTLSSQSGYQELAGGCGTDLALRFATEGKDPPAWLIRETEPAYFPKAKVGKYQKTTEEVLPCTDCEGRVLRMIDLGEAPGEVGTVAQHRGQVFSWVMALNNDNWDPALLPAARYRDFALTASGEADLSGQEMLEDHLYFFLVSKQPAEPVSSWTAFGSIQELNDLASCKKDSSAPFFQVRLVHALAKPPVELKPIQIPTGDEEEESDDEPVLIQMPPHAPAQSLHQLP
ncbi:MAG TPA: hypothetical protein VJR29_02965 [bacterium]|nr:hypothetical protein [bacterium]